MDKKIDKTRTDLDSQHNVFFKKFSETVEAQAIVNNRINKDIRKNSEDIARNRETFDASIKKIAGALQKAQASIKQLQEKPQVIEKVVYMGASGGE